MKKGTYEKLLELSDREILIIILTLLIGLNEKDGDTGIELILGHLLKNNL